MIKQLVVLNFDPKTASQEFQKVFANDLTRTLWLAIKQSHLTDQYFCKSIIRYAVAINAAKEEGKLSAETLFRILSGFASPPLSGVIGPSERSFAEELLPFVTGEKTITFEISNT